MTLILLIVADGLAVLGAAILSLLAANHLRLLIIGVQLRQRLLAAAPTPLGGEIELPDVLVQIPIFNEAQSVEGAIEAAAALDWPKHRLVVQLLDDSDDETGQIASAAIERLSPTGVVVDHVRRASRSGFKAGALSAGLARSSAPYVAMLDADFRAPADWLRRGIGMLDADQSAAFAQFRFEVGNRMDGLLTRAQSLLVDTHFLVEQTGRAAAGEPLQFNGTAGIWRRSAIESAGGWSADTLAEDLDLALRAQEHGWHGVLALQPALRCEAPSEPRTWRAQQRRWSRGFMQVAARVLQDRGTRSVLSRNRFAMLMVIGLQLALPAVIAVAVGLAGDGVFRGFGRFHAIAAGTIAFCALAVLITITAPPYRALHRGGLVRYASDLAALPVLLLMLVLANSASVLTAPFGHDRDFVRTPKRGLPDRGSEERR